MELVRPARCHLDSYAAALKTGWSPNNMRPQVAQEELALIEQDADAFLRGMDMREPGDALVTLPDGSKVPRLPGYRRWMWDAESSDGNGGGFCGNIGFRWQPGGGALPAYCLGHVGYSVVPWKRGQGHATRALQLLLPEALAQGLEYIELTTETWNIASQRVIEKNGGMLFERFEKPAAYGVAEILLRYRIALR